MKIELREMPVRDVVDGYADNAEGGVVGYGGKLNIRPAFQREFIYNEKQRGEVINTIRKNFPLNTMYWAVASDGFELMDGQQRTISVCQYVQGVFSVEVDGSPMYFNNLTKERQNQILDYGLSVYVCEGTEGEKLDWFKIINIASVKLTDQELRNAIYTGPWLSDAKRWFSRNSPPAVQEGRDKLIKGTPNRQEILETAIDWISDGEIERYMAAHQHDKDAQELWQYWQEVFSWVKRVFPNQESTQTKLMKGLPWGQFYNEHKGKKLNAAELEKRIAELVADKEVGNNRGIYEYLLTGDERTLSLRTFDDDAKVMVYEKQKGVCPHCKEHFELAGMEADHIIPWSKGGKTEIDNCQMLCKKCNGKKGGK